ncbi:hypothetical protein GCM10011348_14220 [Marinobacterium nitratireducens]|uniref:Common-antigen outer membrane protein n=1 Tax=Marinobacterium nitratireducens TaxID=518897 RepID=A0A917ZBN4_9GAMM|nr:DVU3141 family protein [Marinobacterium nitratireducens]GGO79582.1 hypothetical protein GCM10011348_14220 [Marinobacterium nitratireducens]
MLKGFESQMYRISTGRAKATVSLLAALVLAGCSSNQTRDAYSATAQPPVVSKGQALSQEVSGFLSTGSGQSTRYFASTYWGDNVELTTDATYYAASGRICRQVSVSSMTGTSAGRWLACEGGNGQWVAVRSLSAVAR